MQVAKGLVYALEKKIRMRQLPQLTLPDLLLAYQLKSNMQRKSCQLHSQHIHSTVEPLISVYFVPVRTLSLQSVTSVAHFYFSKIFHILLISVPVYSLAFTSLLRFRFLKYNSDMSVISCPLI